MDARDVLSAVGGVEGALMLAALMIRFAGLEKTTWGKRVLSLSKDLIGFARAKKMNAPSITKVV